MKLRTLSLGALALLAACGSAGAATSTTTAPPATEAIASTELPATTAAATTAPEPATTTAPPAPTTPATVPTVTVIEVVDGDTITVSTGSTVRIVGIDTPERGQPGATEATARLRELVAGKAVVLTAGARDDTDKYGRLLRYVDVDGVDAGRTLVADGLAVARYDSRDGYGAHPREADYVAADAASPARFVPTTAAPAVPTTAAKAKPAPAAPQPAAPKPAAPRPAAPKPAAPQPPAGGGTDPRFPTCKAAKAAGYGPYTSGQTEYGWYRDADSDGIVCE